MLGAAPGIAQKALESINRREGREVVVGAHAPSMQFVNDPAEIDEVIDIINAQRRHLPGRRPRRAEAGDLDHRTAARCRT